MKRIILSFVTLIATTLIGYAQDHIQTTTGFTNTCNNYGTIGTDGYTFDGWVSTGGGGWGDVKNDTMNYNFYAADGATVYAWIELNAAVNLTSPNNMMDFYVGANGINGSDTSITISVKLETGSGASTVGLSDAVDLGAVNEDYSHETPVFTAASGQSLAAVTKITFYFTNNSGAGRHGAFFLTKLKAGSSITAGTKDASASIASSKVYPNPVTDQASVELNLKSASAIKVTLSDLMGKEVMTIEEGTFSTLNKEFSVAGLNKGIYSVNYYINGAAAKAEMLMVK